MPVQRLRGERLQIMLAAEELAMVEDFRFKKRMPSRAAAVRELFVKRHPELPPLRHEELPPPSGS